MKQTTLLLSLGLTASLGTATWLFLENRNLKLELADAAALCVPAKSARRGTSARPDGNPLALTHQPATTGSTGSLPTKGTSASDVPANPFLPPGGKETLSIADNGDGTFTVSVPNGSWKSVMSAGELRALGQTMDAAMQASVTKVPGGPSWSPGRAAGAPDTADHGDYSTAWASQNPDGGKEWLQVKYPKTVEIGEINIHETYNSGAISKVSALMPDGSQKLIWEGTMNPEAGVVERAVKVPRGIRSDQIRIELDTSRVPGWNEIDAVELVGTDGSRQWGAESTASSYFGQGRGGGVVFSERLDLGEGERESAALPAALDR